MIKHSTEHFSITWAETRTASFSSSYIEASNSESDVQSVVSQSYQKPSFSVTYPGSDACITDRIDRFKAKLPHFDGKFMTNGVEVWGWTLTPGKFMAVATRMNYGKVTNENTVIEHLAGTLYKMFGDTTTQC